jgi:hypothetical protein
MTTQLFNNSTIQLSQKVSFDNNLDSQKENIMSAKVKKPTAKEKAAAKKEAKAQLDAVMALRLLIFKHLEDGVARETTDDQWLRMKVGGFYQGWLLQFGLKRDFKTGEYGTFPLDVLRTMWTKNPHDVHARPRMSIDNLDAPAPFSAKPDWLHSFISQAQLEHLFDLIMSGVVKPWREGMKEDPSEPTLADKLAGHKWLWNFIKDIESISYFTFQGRYKDGNPWTATWPGEMFAEHPATKHIIVKKYAFDPDRKGPFHVQVPRDDAPVDEFIHNAATGRHERTQVVEFDQRGDEADASRAVSRDYNGGLQQLAAFRDQCPEGFRNE